MSANGRKLPAMDAAGVPPYPHLSWLGAWRTVGPAGETVELQMRQSSHCLIYTDRARAAVRWVCRGREVCFGVDAGMVRFAPADDEEHTLVGSCTPWHRFFTLLIPRQHLVDVAAAEGIAAVPALRHALCAGDALLTSAMRTLAHHVPDHRDPADDGHEVAGLTLVLRLLTMNGAKAPEWRSDGSVFPRRILNELVAYIDEHLHPTPTLGDIAPLVGMSPGHFARKFSLSTGTSLHRFVQRRRIRKSLSMLQEPGAQIAWVAKELGFASQSHFTRLFSSLTGMTPARYQRQFRPVMG